MHTMVYFIWLYRDFLKETKVSQYEYYGAAETPVRTFGAAP